MKFFDVNILPKFEYILTKKKVESYYTNCKAMLGDWLAVASSVAVVC